MLALALALAFAGCGGGSGDGTAPTLPGTSQPASAPSPSGVSVPPVVAPTAPPSPASPVPAPAPPTQAVFVNPLRTPGPDPHVTRANGVYYYTQTLGGRIGLWVTPAMSRLDRARYVTVFVPPSTGPNSRDLWAPELHRLDGRWYLYYSAGDGTRTANDPHASQRLFVLENEHPDPTQGTWIDRGRLASPDPDAWAIDGTVLEHGGRRYFVWSGRAFADDVDQHLYIAEMTNPWTLARRVRLSSPWLAWERTGRVGVNEGPQVLRSPRGDVFLTYSASGCWTDDYALGLLALRPGGDPLNADDWTKSERPVFVGNHADGAWGPGHNSFFESPDGTEDWLVYHANPYAGAGCGDVRSARMQRIEWHADETPDFGVPAPVGWAMTVPSGER